jgi:plasmid maintenance system antidote protein VapI
MTIEEVAAWSGMRQTVVERILLNQIPMSTEIAFRLAMATGISEKIWLHS